MKINQIDFQLVKKSYMLKYVKVIALYYKNTYLCLIKLKKTIINI